MGTVDGKMELGMVVKGFNEEEVAVDGLAVDGALDGKFDGAADGGLVCTRLGLPVFTVDGDSEGETCGNIVDRITDGVLLGE